MTVIIFLIVLAVLIFVHEWGHFIFARLNGIRVDAFKIGFGPKILTWKRGETEYGVNLIPFGGFVKIHGENPDEDSMNGPDKGRSFVNKNRWQQASVLIAGVLFNFIFAWLLYFSVFATGVTATPDGFDGYAEYFHNERVMITSVSLGSPAEKVGLKEGDVILDVKGQTMIPAIQDAINASAGQPITIKYLRGSTTESVKIDPVQGLVSGKYAIGIGMSDVVDVRLPVLISLWEGMHYTGIMMRETVIGLYTFVTGIFMGTANFSDVAGPVGIAGIVGNAAAMGFRYLLMITALISINLGIINLIPFPALDGGRILFVVVEGIIRRRISPKFTNLVNTVGFVLLMILMVVITYKDILKLVK